MSEGKKGSTTPRRASRNADARSGTRPVTPATLLSSTRRAAPIRPAMNAAIESEVTRKVF